MPLLSAVIAATLLLPAAELSVDCTRFLLDSRPFRYTGGTTPASASLTISTTNPSIKARPHDSKRWPSFASTASR